MEKSLEYRDKIYILRLSRKVLAGRMGLTYASLSARLTGFTPWQKDEETQLQRIIEQAEAGQAAEAEKDSEKPLAFYQK